MLLFSLIITSCEEEEEGVYNEDIFTSNSWAPEGFVADYDLTYFYYGQEYITFEESLDIYEEYEDCELDFVYNYLSTGVAEIVTGSTYCYEDVPAGTSTQYGTWSVEGDVLSIEYNDDYLSDIEEDDILTDDLGMTFKELSEDELVLEIVLTEDQLNEYLGDELGQGFSVSGSIIMTITYESGYVNTSTVTARQLKKKATSTIGSRVIKPIIDQLSK